MRKLHERPVLAIASVGLACVLCVVLGGWLTEWLRLGTDDDASFAKVQREVRDQFGSMIAELRAMARDEATLAATVLQSPRDQRDLRPMFQRASELVADGAGPRRALTVYGGDGAPLAWAGRPTELPQERVGGAGALFITPGPLGHRLVWTEPVGPAGARPSSRLGLVACERLFSEQAAVGGPVSETFTLDTSVTTVVLRARYDGAAGRSEPFSFTVSGPSGEPLVEASVDPTALRTARTRHRAIVAAIALGVVGLTLVLLVGPCLDRRALARTGVEYMASTLVAVALLVVARLFFAGAFPPSSVPWLSPQSYSWPAVGLLAPHPFGLLLSSLVALAIVALLAGPVERARLAFRHRQHLVFAEGRISLLFGVAAVLAGIGLCLAVIGYEQFLAATFRQTAIDVLYFSPNPWLSSRVVLATGLVLAHAVFAWAAVLALRLVLAPWRFRRSDLRVAGVLIACWGTPLALLWILPWQTGRLVFPRLEALLIVVALSAAAVLAPRSLVRLRHASQGFRLTVAFLALLAPAAVMYPSLVHHEDIARRRTVEGTYGPEVLRQRVHLQERLKKAQEEIDARETALRQAVSLPAPPADATVPADTAFFMWQGTALGRYRVSSAVELYNASGSLVSRFALNLPELTRRPGWHEDSCTWKVFGEISPFGAHERQLLHAGRDICMPDGIAGTVVIQVLLDDNSTLPFISSQNPYVELLRGQPTQPKDESPERDLQFVYYGWSRTPLYSLGTTAWPIADDLFARICATRTPFWTRIPTDDGIYEVYFENDRTGVYALGYLRTPGIGHAINLAELTALVALTYVMIILGGAMFRVLGFRRVQSGRALLREIRESFYRKLFLAFVAVSIVPVITLALVTRAYVADRLRHEVDSSAHRTTQIARQIIEDYTVVARQGLEGADVSQASAPETVVTDDALVGLSRAIGQDVNVFTGPLLQATSERDLFASGLLPTRTPADVYRAIVLDRMPTTITEERAGTLQYIVAAAPVRPAGQDAILTVPLTFRQKEIEREIDALNRRIVLAAMLFMLVSAAIGYPMAERIADPVKRLTRATRRIAMGDFDARIAVASSDELKRLVEAFNTMSAELQRQRVELERTHRLEAWAEMARQVAHDIKNPLTPIQLSAEHLRRVHADRGKPLEPILEGCVDSILSQVRLLRQIASEFSSFASSPTARLEAASLADLVDEVVRPYTPGASERLTFEMDVPATLPPVQIDRTLLGRALTNIVDNALHAMPGPGTLRVEARHLDADRVALTVTDTGIGMDAEAQRRVFEPYFSTKAVGTGLGLAIARRNVELIRGTIAVESERGRGTRVTITLPVAGQSVTGSDRATSADRTPPPAPETRRPGGGTA